MLTKSDLRQIKVLIHTETFKVRDDLNLSLKKEISNFKNQIFTLLDKVMGELKAIREEQTVITGYKDQIEDHETRIGKLEEVLQPQTS